MEVPQLRPLEERFHISKLLDEATLTGRPLTLWQNETFERLIYEVNVAALYERKKRFKVVPKGSRLKLNDELPVFLYSPYKYLILKTKIILSSQFSAYLAIPSFAKAVEQRHNPRMTFPKDYGNLITYSKLVPHQREARIFSSELFDISSEGLALRIPITEAHNFFVGDILHISKMSVNPFNLPIEGNIIYIERLYEKGQLTKHYRVGVKFTHDPYAKY